MISFFLGLIILSSCIIIGETKVDKGFFGTTKKTSSAKTIETRFISTWRTTSPSENITLPLRAGYNYNFTVDWGDGSTIDTVTSSGDANRIHNYTVAGDYTITIEGLAEAWYFNNAGDKLKVISVENFGDLSWKSFEADFHGCSNMTSFSGGNTDAVTNMKSMFLGASGLTSLDLSNFDTAAVINKSSMFLRASNITSLDLSNFNTAAVTNMGRMFDSASGGRRQFKVPTSDSYNYPLT